MQQPLHVTSNDGHVGFGPGGDRYVTKLAAAQTGGLFNLTDIIIPPGSGPPLHLHESEDEVFMVSEGEMTFWIDGRRIVGKPGDVVYAPRRIAHTFKNCSSVPARAMVLITPPESEQFFRRFTEPAADGQPAEDHEIIDRILRLAPEYGIEILGPSPL